MPESATSARLAREARLWFDDLRAMMTMTTRLPAAAGLTPVMPRAMRAMPVAGAIAGAIGGVVLMLAAAIGLPPAGSALFAIAALVLLTGALHEDGLADTADGFGGGEGPAEKLEIMRDSRVGSYGAIALVLALLARVLLAAALIGPVGSFGACLALVAAGALSRAGMVHVLTMLEPARADGLGHGAGTPERTIWLQAMIAALVIALIVVTPAIGFAALLAAILGAALATIAVAMLARRQIGGQTGDVCGAAQQAAEIAVLAGLVIGA